LLAGKKGKEETWKEGSQSVEYREKIKNI